MVAARPWVRDESRGVDRGARSGSASSDSLKNGREPQTSRSNGLFGVVAANQNPRVKDVVYLLCGG